MQVLEAAFLTACHLDSLISDDFLLPIGSYKRFGHIFFLVSSLFVYTNFHFAEIYRHTLYLMTARRGKIKMASQSPDFQ